MVWTDTTGPITLGLYVGEMLHDVEDSSTLDCPDLEIAKTVGPVGSEFSENTSLELTGGGSVTYFFTIRNISDFDLIISATDTHLSQVAANWPEEGTPLPANSSVTFPVTKSFPNQNLEKTNTFVVNGWRAGDTWTDTYQATATVTVTASETPPPTTPPTTTSSPGNPDFTVSKLVSTTNSVGTGQSSITITNGGTVYYFYTVTNTGNVPVVIVEAEDDILGPVNFSPSTINPGQTATATLQKSFDALALGSQPQVESNVLSVSVGFNGNVIGPRTATATVTNNSLPADSVTVRVLDNSQRNTGIPQPIANADVSLSNGLSGQTNANGEIVFNNLAFGTYSATGASVDPVTGLDRQEGSGSATIDSASPNEVINILLAWTPALVGPAPTPSGKLAATKGSITVLVLDGSPRNNGVLKPITGADVTLAGRMGKTNGSGRVTFDNLDFATYMAFAEAVDPMNPTAGEKRNGSGQAEISAQYPNERVTIVLAWEQPLAAPTGTASVAATELSGSLAGRICAPRAPGAELVATDAAGRTVRTFVAATGKLGVWLQYTLENLAPGSWTLTLNNPGDAPAEQKLTVRSGETVIVPDFSLACTGQPGTQLPVSPYYLIGALMVMAGLLLRRFGKADA